MSNGVKTKKDLQREYKISYNTLLKWLSDVPGLILDKKKRLFTPKEVELIYSHLGKPE